MMRTKELLIALRPYDSWMHMDLLFRTMLVPDLASASACRGQWKNATIGSKIYQL